MAEEPVSLGQICEILEYLDAVCVTLLNTNEDDYESFLDYNKLIEDCQILLNHDFIAESAFAHLLLGVRDGFALRSVCLLFNEYRTLRNLEDGT